MSAGPVWAILLTLSKDEQLRGAELSEVWSRWDDQHFLAPLGTPLPVFGTAENVRLDVAALPERYTKSN